MARLPIIEDNPDPDAFHETDLQQVLVERGVSAWCSVVTRPSSVSTRRYVGQQRSAMRLLSPAMHDKPHAEATAIIADHNDTLPNITSFGVKISAVGQRRR